MRRPFAPHYNENNREIETMAYLIQRGEPAADEVRRVFRAQNRHALELLADWQADPADRIHRARRICKKIRALVRLFRPAFPYVFQVENRIYRDVQRSVAYARDSEAIVESLDLLRSLVTEPYLLESIDLLRSALVSRAASAIEDSRPQLLERIEAACDDLALADRRLARLPLDGLRRRDLRRGAAQTWRRCARHFDMALTSADPEVLHALRKNVKYAYYQHRVLSRLVPERFAALNEPLHELEQTLGRSQDLVLLDRLLRDQPDSLHVDTHLHRLRRLVSATREQLRQQGIAIASPLFVPVPDENGDRSAEKLSAGTGDA
jgi:CHAD domain-containing protein